MWNACLGIISYAVVLLLLLFWIKKFVWQGVWPFWWTCVNANNSSIRQSLKMHACQILVTDRMLQTERQRGQDYWVFAYSLQSVVDQQLPLMHTEIIPSIGIAWTDNFLAEGWGCVNLMILSFYILVWHRESSIPGNFGFAITKC